MAKCYKCGSEGAYAGLFDFDCPNCGQDTLPEDAQTLNAQAQRKFVRESEAPKAERDPVPVSAEEDEESVWSTETFRAWLDSVSEVQLRALFMAAAEQVIHEKQQARLRQAVADRIMKSPFQEARTIAGGGHVVIACGAPRSGKSTWLRETYPDARVFEYMESRESFSKFCRLIDTHRGTSGLLLVETRGDPAPFKKLAHKYKFSVTIRHFPSGDKEQVLHLRSTPEGAPATQVVCGPVRSVWVDWDRGDDRTGEGTHAKPYKTTERAMCDRSPSVPKRSQEEAKKALLTPWSVEDKEMLRKQAEPAEEGRPTISFERVPEINFKARRELALKAEFDLRTQLAEEHGRHRPEWHSGAKDPNDVPALDHAPAGSMYYREDGNVWTKRDTSAWRGDACPFCKDRCHVCRRWTKEVRSFPIAPIAPECIDRESFRRWAGITEPEFPPRAEAGTNFVDVRTTQVIINGKPCIVPGVRASYDTIRVLSEHLESLPSITYKSERYYGTLKPGQVLEVEDGMVFNVVRTGNA